MARSASLRPPAPAIVCVVDATVEASEHGPVTVVIPALDAADTLPAQLDALAGQTYDQPFEVIVVDNGSTDGTGDVARAHSVGERARVRVVHEARRGINSSRNAGIDAAADGRVLLCDADDVVDAGWLAAMVTALSDGVWVAGRLDYTVLNTDRTREIWGVGLHSTFVETDPFVDNTYGCNCGFHRAMWSEIGRFDPRLNGTGGDENEFFMRAHAAGFRPRHVPDAIAGYRLRPGVRAMTRQRYRQGKNQVAMRRLAGGRLLPEQFTVASEVRLTAKTLAVLPLYLRSTRRRCSWLGSTSRHAGRLVALTCARLGTNASTGVAVEAKSGPS
jgi:glycosyltransferase involved in cell wall biosynthesis